MNENEFNFYKWQVPIITSFEELTQRLKDLSLTGRCIREIWNIGIIYS